MGIVKIWDRGPYTAPVVWGKPLPGSAAEDQAPPGPAPVSPTRIAAAAALVGVLVWALASVMGLGPNLDVVLVAAFGAAGAVRYGRGRRRLAVVTLLAVAVVGIGWIEAVNKAQYGTLALRGAPPLVRWCGATYRPSGVISSEPSTGSGPTETPILRSPSGYAVFGVAPGPGRACAANGALFVDLGSSHYAAYDAGPASHPVLAR